jgi:hypothetical protein
MTRKNPEIICKKWLWAYTLHYTCCTFTEKESFGDYCKLSLWFPVKWWYSWWYCGWKKSCTTLDGWNPIYNGIKHLSTRAGFLPSTVCSVDCIGDARIVFLQSHWTRWQDRVHQVTLLISRMHEHVLFRSLASYETYIMTLWHVDIYCFITCYYYFFYCC